MMSMMSIIHLGITRLKVAEVTLSEWAGGPNCIISTGPAFLPVGQKSRCPLSVGRLCRMIYTPGDWPSNLTCTFIDTFGSPSLSPWSFYLLGLA